MAPSLAAPGADEVHVWWIDLARMPEDAGRILSSAERARADRFRRAHDRVRWVAARVALRQILARYLGTSPADVTFAPGGVSTTRRAPTADERPALGEGGGEARGDGGKPALANGSPLRFNLTHAADRAALAVAWEREVGIDLEPVDPRLDLPSLLAVACTPAESARIAALPPAARAEAFLRIWTLKEAYLKALGAGLSREPRSVEIDLLPGARADVRDLDSPLGSAPWSLHLLDAGPDWVAALAVAGAGAAVRSLLWPAAR